MANEELPGLTVEELSAMSTAQALELLYGALEQHVTAFERESVQAPLAGCAPLLPSRSGR